MAFWNKIQTYIGKTNFGVELSDKLALEQSDGGWVAGLSMYTYKENNNFRLSNENIGGAKEKVSVYFLCWKRDAVSKVTFETLKNFDFFLTSEFTGCRFVVTEVGVAHIAWSAGRDPSTWSGTSAQRDKAEWKALSYANGRPVYRRKLSLSSGSQLRGGLDQKLKNSNNAAQSYDNESALVFGYRVAGGWAFKVLRYPSGAGSQAGTWSNFACTWAA